jgi:RNA polymerase sigma-70 factor (ECF subfamily)
VSGLEITLSVYDDEAELLAGLRRGDSDACTCMVKRFASLVYAHALRIVNDPDEAEGVLQLTFVKACEKIATFEGRSGLGTWLYRIATNEALMKLRRQKMTQVPIEEIAETISPDDLPQNMHAWPIDPAHAALGAELRRHLEAALMALPEGLRLVFILRELQGLSTDETATTLGVSAGTVKVRLHRARLRLRELLAEYLGDLEGGTA